MPTHTEANAHTYTHTHARARAHTHTHTHTHTRTHARTRARTHTHTHTTATTTFDTAIIHTLSLPPPPSLSLSLSLSAPHSLARTTRTDPGNKHYPITVMPFVNILITHYSQSVVKEQSTRGAEASKMFLLATIHWSGPADTMQRLSTVAPNILIPQDRASRVDQLAALPFHYLTTHTPALAAI